MPENPFFNKDFISADQITSIEMVRYLFEIADKMRDCVENKESCRFLENFSIPILFYQASSRTYSSFYHAADRLGALITPIHGMTKLSSALKGETLADTIRTFNYSAKADAIVLRHPEDTSSEIAALYSEAPVINAGSGSAEHPTQALLDLLTIEKYLGIDRPLKVGLVNDLKFSRTTKSLAKLLAVVSPESEIFLISPRELKMPRKLVKELKATGIKIQETEQFEKVLPKLDVAYMTRVQEEWFADPREYERLKDKMRMNTDRANMMKEDSIIMHPLPRQTELRYGVDENHRAVYFPQIEYGLYTRMALLLCILQENPMSLLGLTK